MTKLFFDTEFTGLHQNTTLISIGIISEDGRTFYAEFTDYDRSQVDSWIEENVIAKLKYGDKIKREQSTNPFLTEGSNYTGFGDTKTIRRYLEVWLAQFPTGCQMWSDCLSYDWVLFCSIWLHAFKVPKVVYYIPFDICPLLLQKEGDADINREDYVKDILDTTNANKHNALWDAIVIQKCHQKLTE